MQFSVKSALSLIAATFMLAGCSSSTENDIDYLAVKSDKDSNWGMIGPDGKILFDDEFENRPSAVINGLFTVEENKGISVYKAAEKPELVADLEGLKDAGVMSDGVIPATRPGERIKYYNADGKMVFELLPYKKKELTNVRAYFSDGMAAVWDEEDNIGFINNKGEMKIEPKYATCTEFSEGYAAVVKKADMEKEDEAGESAESEDGPSYPTYIINKKGEEVAKLTGIAITSNMIGGKFAAKKGDRYGFVDKKGEFTKLPSKVQSIWDFNEKFVVYTSEDSKVGVMNMDGEIVIRAKYEYISMMPGDKFLCKSNSKKFYIVNANDERETTFEDMDYLVYLKGFGLIGGEEHAISFYKEDGEPLIKNDFYDISASANSLVTTDYFNATGAADKLASYITENGACGVTIDTPLYKYFKGEPKDYSGVDRYNFEDVKGGFRYSISGYAYTNSYVVNSVPVYTTQTYYGYSFQNFDHYNYVWNTEGMVNLIRMELNAFVEGQFNTLKEAFTNAMKAKGFTVAANTKAYTLFKKGKVNVFVGPDSSYDTSSLALVIYDAKGWDSNRASLISSAESNYESIAEKQNTKATSKDVEEAVEVVEAIEAVDTVAVEEVADVDVVAADTVSLSVYSAK